MTSLHSFDMLCACARYILISQDPTRKKEGFYHDTYEGEKPLQAKAKRCPFCDQFHNGACTPAALEQLKWKAVPPSSRPRYQSYQTHAQSNPVPMLPMSSKLHVRVVFGMLCVWYD